MRTFSAHWPTISNTMAPMIGAMSDNLDNYAGVDALPPFWLFPWFFVAPGLVPLAAIPGRAQDLVRLNPLTGIFEGYRDALLYRRRPAAWELVYPLAVGAVLLVSFVPVYRLEQRQFAKIVE